MSPVAVAVPARNEAGLIGRCLDALAAQRGAGPFTVTVMANDCDDDTAAVARAPRGLDVRVIEARFPPAARHAGRARREAMAAAAGTGAPILLTTDADCVADADWIARHRALFATGLDAVLGRVSGDKAEMDAFSDEARAIGRLEWDYLVLIAEGQARFDPRPHDPLPRHAQCCGANLAITRAMLETVGGVPAIPTGEDRALIDLVERAGGRVRHDPGPHVVASARLDGRATGGMADALKGRLSPGYLCDAQFRPAAALLAEWRGRASGRLPRMVEPSSGRRLTPADLPAEIAALRSAIADHDRAAQLRTVA